LRKLFVLFLVLVGLWVGYWVLGKTAKEAFVETWFAERRAAGWTAQYRDYGVSGFPISFNSHFTDLNLYDPRARMGWEAPRFDILARAYRPYRVTAEFAHTQLVVLPHQDVTISSRALSAGIAFQPGTSMTLSALDMSAQQLTFKSNLGWRMGVRKLIFSTRQNGDQRDAHDIKLDLVDVTPTDAMQNNLDPTGTLPDTIDRLFFDVTLGFSGPWDRIAVEEIPPMLTSIEVNNMDLKWGDLALGGDGLLKVSAKGLLTGRFTLVVSNWRGVLDLLVAGRIIDAGSAGGIRQAVAFLNAGAGDPGRLTMPLDLRRDGVYLGPIKIAPPQKIRRRHR